MLTPGLVTSREERLSNLFLTLPAAKRKLIAFPESGNCSVELLSGSRLPR
jgi:hypothetical protein